MSKSSLKTKTEKYPVPSTVDGICSLFREVMSKGRVQRIEFDVDSPVRVIRAVQDDDPNLVEPDVDMDGALRNIEMVEYVSEGASSFQVLVDMMLVVQSEGLNPICWATGPSGAELIQQWLELKERGMPTNVDKLMGLVLHQLRSLPRETLILCASKYPGADPDEFDLAVKATVEMRRPNDEDITRNPTDDSIRNGARERTPSAYQLAIASGELRRVAWNEPSDDGE